MLDLQGHRGARGLKPENTLPSFEVAIDLGVTSIETDVHLTSDSVPVLVHDAFVSTRLCRLIPGRAAPDPACRPAVNALTLAQLQSYRADLNPDPHRFPEQDNRVTPLAELVAASWGIDPYAPPTLRQLFEFARAYAGTAGASAGKTDLARRRAQALRFDLDLKRVPFRPERTDRLEERVLSEIRAVPGMPERTQVRCFDHRSVRRLLTLEPRLTGAVLVAGTAPVAPAEVAHRAGAHVYAPEFEFIDQELVRELHAAGLRVLPWTVNDLDDMKRLLDWGVDGLTTDYPDRGPLAASESARGGQESRPNRTSAPRRP
jgi:glycerophosphoryl diester phosphodiesterase